MASARFIDSNRGDASDFIGECTVTRSCEPCLKTYTSKEAAVFCKNCNEFLCETCRNPHIAYKPGQHRMVIIQEMESSPVVVDMKGMDMCPEHGKVFEFVCEDHSKLCCTSCVITHRKCDKLDEIATISLQKGAEIDNMKQRLLKLESDADANVTECKQSENKLNESIRDIFKEVDDLGERFIKQIEEAKREFLTKANALKGEEVQRLNDRHALNTKVMDQINEILSIFSAISKQGTIQQMYIFSKQIEEKCKNIGSAIKEQRTTQVTTKVAMSYPRELSSLLEMGNNFIEVYLERTDTNTKKKRAKVVFSYEPQMEDELKIDIGDMVDIIKQEEEGWWEGTVNGKQGLFPSNFVEMIKDEDSINITDTTDLDYNIPTGLAPQLQFQDLEVERSSVKLQQKLGNGNFGQVWAGKWRKMVDVAVKILNPGQATSEAVLEEAKLMHRLRYPKLVQLMAVCTKSEPIWIIAELMVNGPLLNYLRDDNGKTMTFDIIVYMAGQIADGMAYLEANNCIHRDLRAANILVGQHNEVKVAGFKLARFMGENKYVQYSKGTKFPIKWTPIEALLDLKWSIKSDVWSYGVLLYELITLGKSPYPGMPKSEVFNFLDKGNNMPLPTGGPIPCPDPYYEHMVKCWNRSPKNRPTFDYLQAFFNNYAVSTERG